MALVQCSHRGNEAHLFALPAQFGDFPLQCRRIANSPWPFPFSSHRATGPPINTSYRSAEVAHSRRSLMSVKKLTIFEIMDVCIVNERLVRPLSPEIGLPLSATRSFDMQASISVTNRGWKPSARKNHSLCRC